MNSLELQVQKEFAANSGFLDKDSFISYNEIFEAYSNSEEGRFQASQQLRYSNYAYDRKEMLRDLGDDVHPLLHMPYTYRQIVNPLLKEQVSADKANELSPHDIKAVRLSALLHDIGECEHPSFKETCGDVHKFDRTPEDELIEQAVRQQVYEDKFKFVPDELLERVEDIVMKTDPTDFATKTFEIAEELGDFKTGIKAGEVLIIEKPANLEVQRNRQLAQIALIVPSNWIDKLDSAATTYPHIQKELFSTHSLYKAIQNQIRPNVVV